MIMDRVNLVLGEGKTIIWYSILMLIGVRADIILEDGQGLLVVAL